MTTSQDEYETRKWIQLSGATGVIALEFGGPRLYRKVHHFRYSFVGPNSSKISEIEELFVTIKSALQEDVQ